MLDHSFTAWFKHRDHTPQTDKIVPMIAQAGTRGMTRHQIGSIIKLNRDVLDDFLAGLVQAGLLTITNEGGLRVYRTTGL